MKHIQKMEVLCATMAQVESFVNMIEAIVVGGRHLDRALLIDAIASTKATIFADVEVNGTREMFDKYKKAVLDEFFASDDGRAAVLGEMASPSKKTH